MFSYGVYRSFNNHEPQKNITMLFNKDSCFFIGGLSNSDADVGGCKATHGNNYGFRDTLVVSDSTRYNNNKGYELMVMMVNTKPKVVQVLALVV